MSYHDDLLSYAVTIQQRTPHPARKEGKITLTWTDLSAQMKCPICLSLMQDTVSTLEVRHLCLAVAAFSRSVCSSAVSAACVEGFSFLFWIPGWPDVGPQQPLLLVTYAVLASLLLGMHLEIITLRQ